MLAVLAIYVYEMNHKRADRIWHLGKTSQFHIAHCHIYWAENQGMFNHMGFCIVTYKTTSLSNKKEQSLFSNSLKTSGYRVKNLYSRRDFSGLVENESQSLGKQSHWEGQCCKVVPIRTVTPQFRPDIHLNPLLEFSTLLRNLFMGKHHFDVLILADRKLEFPFSILPRYVYHTKQGMGFQMFISLLDSA